jgi:hypothetical protein
MGTCDSSSRAVEESMCFRIGCMYADRTLKCTIRNYDDDADDDDSGVGCNNKQRNQHIHKMQQNLIPYCEILVEKLQILFSGVYFLIRFLNHRCFQFHNLVAEICRM